MTIYEKFIEQVTDEKRFSIDLVDKSMKVNGRWLIENGKYKGELITAAENVWEELEELYEEYKFSYTNGKRRGSKPYFKAEEGVIEIADLVYGTERNLAQAKLEGYILCHSLLGDLKIEKGWFWMSDKDKSFVILKEWT